VNGWPESGCGESLRGSLHKGLIEDVQFRALYGELREQAEIKDSGKVLIGLCPRDVSTKAEGHCGPPPAIFSSWLIDCR
jgi:hypothetical protein